MTDPIYQIRQLCHRYGEKTVVDIPSLDIPRGSILGISGANGSGKSTLLKLLAFTMASTRGDIRFNGRSELPLSPRVRSRVTLLTQTPYLLKRSVLENVTYGLKIRSESPNKAAGLREQAARALSAVGLDPRSFSHRMWHQLSGGEAQRVAMAARLILRPQALLLDEPVASVDAASANLIRKASLAARKEWGCTLIIISHDLSWLHEVSDTRITMDGGKVFSTGEESIIPRPLYKRRQWADDPDAGQRPGHSPGRRSPGDPGPDGGGKKQPSSPLSGRNSRTGNQPDSGRDHPDAPGEKDRPDPRHPGHGRSHPLRQRHPPPGLPAGSGPRQEDHPGLQRPRCVLALTSLPFDKAGQPVLHPYLILLQKSGCEDPANSHKTASVRELP